VSQPTVITTVVFDLGGVLIDWDPRHLYRQMFADPEEMEIFLRDVVSPDWNAEQDAGRTWAEATALLLVQHPEHEPMITAYVERWDEMLAGPLEGSVAVLSDARDAGLRIYALTNWSAETFPRARPLFPFLEWFEGIVVSGDEGIRKPDPEIWRRLISRYAIDPTTTVYIDDMPRNVEVATDLGFQAIRFESPEDLRARLVELRVLPA
jgi:2-haloacid dehalogenase